jgi:hypothetical protein
VLAWSSSSSFFWLATTLRGSRLRGRAPGVTAAAGGLAEELVGPVVDRVASHHQGKVGHVQHGTIVGAVDRRGGQRLEHVGLAVGQQPGQVHRDGVGRPRRTRKSRAPKNCRSLPRALVQTRPIPFSLSKEHLI